MEQKQISRDNTLKSLEKLHIKVVELEMFLNRMPIKLHKCGMRALLYECESLLMTAYKLAQYDFEFQDKCNSTAVDNKPNVKL